MATNTLTTKRADMLRRGDRVRHNGEIATVKDNRLWEPSPLMDDGTTRVTVTLKAPGMRAWQQLFVAEAQVEVA